MLNSFIHSKLIIVAAISAAFNISISQAKASTGQQGISYHLGSQGITLAKQDGEWKAVGDGAGAQQGLGGGNPADMEARKQAAEEAVQEHLEEEQQDSNNGNDD